MEVSRVFSAAMIETYCSDCGDVEAFEQPPCVDGHGADCPEWLCLTCGAAVLINMMVERSTHTFGLRAA